MTPTEAQPAELARADRANSVLILLLLGRLIFGLAYTALIPLGEAPDEADHYAYAAYIGNEGRLPVGPAMTQGKHPPLYHLLAAGMARLAGAELDFDFLRANPDVGVTSDAPAPNFFVHTTLESWPWRNGPLAMHLGRLVSLVAGVVLVVATYWLGRALWPVWWSGPLAAAAFVAFLPESLFIGSVMSNDMLAAMWITLALWLGLRRGWLSALGAGTCMGLAFVSKASTAALWPVVGLAIAVGEWRARPALENGVRRLLRSLGPAVLAGLLALAIASPWLLRNQRLYGDLLGMPLALATIDQRQGPMTLVDVWVLARGWFLSFWGKFGGAGHISLPAPFYWVWGLLLLATGAGWVTFALDRRQSPAARVRAEGWIVMIGTPVMAVLAILSYSRVALGTDQGRLLFPALAVAGLWIAGGLSAWMPRGRPEALVMWLGGGMAVVALLALIFGITSPFAPPPTPDPGEVAAATAAGQRFGDDLELIGSAWTGQTPPELVLYWRALRPVPVDLRTAMRLLDGKGDLLWEWKRSPGAGRFSTDRWPVGRVVRDAYRIPADLSGVEARLEVGIRPFPEGPWLNVEGTDADAYLLPAGNP